MKFNGTEIHSLTQNNSLLNSALDAEGIGQLLTDAIDALTDGFVIFDNQDRLVTCNQIYRDIYAPYSDSWQPGTSLETIARDTATHCIGIESAEAIETFVSTRLESHPKSSNWNEQQLKNGRWVRVSELVLPGKWTVGIRTDITQLKEIESSLHKSEARFRDYAETAADYFWEVDSDSRYTHISGRYEEAIGISPSKVIGLKRSEVWALSDPDYKNNSAIDSFITAIEAFDSIEIEWTHVLHGKRILSVSGRPFYDDDAVFQGFRGSCRDVTDTRILTEKLSYQASHDSLTKLINRREFENRLEALLETTRNEKSVHALCFMDLDQFKLINDSCGHAAGDELLRQLSTVLQSLARRHDSVARLGGNEFGILMEHCNLENAARVAENFREAVKEFDFEWENNLFSVGVSIGLVPITSYCDDLSQIMRNADSACYSAKKQGRNRVVVFDS